MQKSTQRLYGWTNRLIKRVAQLLRRHGFVGNRQLSEHRRRDTAVFGARNDTHAELVVCLVDDVGRTGEIVKEGVSYIGSDMLDPLLPFRRLMPIERHTSDNKDNKDDPRRRADLVSRPLRSCSHRDTGAAGIRAMA